MRSNDNDLVGVGATPEGLGTKPVVYDLLYELPWISSDSLQAKPDAWLSEWVRCRYGQQSSEVEEAWQLLLQSSLDCRSNLQGPVEAVTCARSSAHTDRISTWGGTEIFYDYTLVARAARLLRSARLSGSNYDYDLTDITRQTWTDSAFHLLKSIQAYHAAGLPANARPVLT